MKVGKHTVGGVTHIVKFDIPSSWANLIRRSCARTVAMRMAMIGVVTVALSRRATCWAISCNAIKTAAPAQNQVIPEAVDNDATPSPSVVPQPIIVTARAPGSGADPWEQVNEKSFAAVQSADLLFVAPLSFAYQKTIPSPLHDGIHNVLYNLRESVVIVNFLLQHRIGKAGRALARLTINSTIGAAGLFDFAKRKPFNLPFRCNGFANTLGFYGIKPGPYMYLPIVGSTSLRDLVGTVADRLFLSTAFGAPFNRPVYRISVVVLGTLDDRLVNDKRIRKARNARANAYITTRNAYLSMRAEEVAALHKPGP